MNDDSKLKDTIRQWQARLLQLDQRNRLLYFNRGSTTVIPIDTLDADGFLDALEGARRGLAFPFQPASARTPQTRFQSQLSVVDPNTPSVRLGDISTPVPVRELQGRLLRLRARDRTFIEEQGLSVLFLACGLLHWVDENDIQAVAPLVLVPCTLDRDSPRDPFYLRRNEDDPLANGTLDHKLRTELRFNSPSFDPLAPISEYLDAVSGSIADKEGWHVEREVHLGIFQYSKMAMWEDLERLTEEDSIEHPLVRFLAGGDTLQPSKDAESSR